LILLYLLHMLLLFLGLNLLVQESLGLHLLLLSIISFALLSEGFLLCLLLGMVFDAVKVLLEFVITCDTSSDYSFSWGNWMVQFILDKFDTTLIDLRKLSGLIMLLGEDRGQHVIGHLWSTLKLLFLLINLSSKLNLLFVWS
jgi:hypothetical protein